VSGCRPLFNTAGSAFIGFPGERNFHNLLIIQAKFLREIPDHVKRNLDHIGDRAARDENAFEVDAVQSL
jgi:hypothetical protein